MFVQRRWASRPPLGYSFQGFEKDAEIVPDPERFPILKKGWELLLCGRYSLDALAGELYHRGLRTRGDRRFPAGAMVKKNTLYDIFTNPFYYGIMRIKGELVPGGYDPMITKAVFDRCQDILHGRGHPRPVRRKEFTYSGFLVCGTCGAAVTVEEKVKAIKRTGQTARYIYYHCTGSKGNATCRRHFVREEVLEAQFAEQLRAIELDQETATGLRKVLVEFHQHEQEYRRTSLETLRRRYDEVQKRKDVLLDAYLERVIPQEEYQRRYPVLQSEQALVQNDIQALEAAQDHCFEEIELLLKLGSRLGQVFEKGDQGTKRAVTRLVASNSTLEGQKARLNLFLPFSLLQNPGGRSRW